MHYYTEPNLEKRTLKLGILVNTDKNVKEVVGLAKAAVLKGHEVIIFMMDEGVRLLHRSPIANLAKIPGITISFCQYSADIIGVSTSKIAKGITSGSQYDNAAMNKEADKVIIL